jgi:molecular chaperone GrpE
VSDQTAQPRGGAPGEAAERPPGQAAGQQPGPGAGQQPGPGAGQQPGQAAGQEPAPGAGQQPGQAAGQQPPGREAELEAEVARLDDRYKRALADLDNYRKRAAREIEQRVAERRDALLGDWLEVFDGMERAVRQTPENPLFEGLRAVLEQMESVLARQGVQRFGTPGEPFDPERHEAIDVRETGEVPDRTVLGVARSGFAREGRVLRPAQVVVSRAPREAQPRPG